MGLAYVIAFYGIIKIVGVGEGVVFDFAEDDGGSRMFSGKDFTAPALDEGFGGIDIATAG